MKNNLIIMLAICIVFAIIGGLLIYASQSNVDEEKIVKEDNSNLEQTQNEIVYNKFLSNINLKYGNTKFDITSKIFYRDVEIISNDSYISIMIQETPASIEFYVTRDIIYGVFTAYVYEPYNISDTFICYMLTTENFASCEVYIGKVES